MVLTDVSGATATEYCLIAAGVGFGCGSRTRAGGRSWRVDLPSLDFHGTKFASRDIHSDAQFPSNFSPSPLSGLVF
jgi:hypothetical protein